MSGPALGSLGCPWCSGELISRSDPAGPHCTSGADCPAASYLANDASLSFSGLGLSQLVEMFFAGLRAHITNAGCDVDDSPAGARRVEVAQKIKRPRVERIVSSPQAAEGGWSRAEEDAVQCLSPNCRCHQMRMELAPLVVSSSRGDFAAIVGPVAPAPDTAEVPPAEDRRGGGAEPRDESHRRARPTFYFLDCSRTGESLFVA